MSALAEFSSLLSQTQAHDVMSLRLSLTVKKMLDGNVVAAQLLLVKRDAQLSGHRCGQI